MYSVSARRRPSITRTVAAIVVGVALGVTALPTQVSAHEPGEPRPQHQTDPAPVSSLSAAPAERHCTVRPGQAGCVSFEPPARGIVVAVLYAEAFYGGARVVVHLEGDVTGCTPRTYDDEGGGDLGGPLASFRDDVGSVETFHRCDVRLHEKFLGGSGTDSGWLHRAARVPDTTSTSAFTIS